MLQLIIYIDLKRWNNSDKSLQLINKDASQQRMYDFLLALSSNMSLCCIVYEMMLGLPSAVPRFNRPIPCVASY